MKYPTAREYEETCLQFQSTGNKLQWIVSITAKSGIRLTLDGDN
jgi:hypothetical protein